MLKSHAQVKEELPAEVLEELEHAEDTADVERGIRKFIEWVALRGIERLIEEEKAERLDAKKFRPEFIIDLRNDLRILNQVQEMWSGMKRDPKWNAFREVFQNVSRFRKRKLIIFTESKETAEYLCDRIANEIDEKVILFTGSSHKGTRETILANFDPRAFQPKDDYRILVTTTGKGSQFPTWMDVPKPLS